MYRKLFEDSHMNTNIRVRWLAMLTIAICLLVIEFGFYLAEAYIHQGDPAEIHLGEIK
jgi:hypothetical protein